MRTRFLTTLVATLLTAQAAMAQLEEREKNYFNRPQDAKGCIGGERCGGGSARLRVGLERRPVVEITFRAHDNVGRQRNGALRVRIDNEVIEPRIQITEQPELYRLTVNRIRGDELIIETVTDDEVEIDALQIRYGSVAGGRVITIRCESLDGREKFCPAETSRGVRLIKQLSKDPCRKGSTWDFNSRGIQVSDGCRADFEVGSSSGESGTGDRYEEQIVRCESTDGRRKLCRAETRGGVTLHKKLSTARCTRGDTWDYDRQGIWVSGGCRADFRLGSTSAGSLPAWDSGSGEYSRTTVQCESSEGRYKRCPADVGSRRVRLTKKLSSSACRAGDDWGYDSSAIWVRNGCRAVFEVGD